MQMRKAVMGMAACAALAACGGGGGGSDGGSSGGGGSGAAVALSASNYEVAANEAVATGLGVTDLAGQANIVTGASVSTQPNWAKIGWQQWLAAAAPRPFRSAPSRGHRVRIWRHGTRLLSAWATRGRKTE